MEKILIIAEKPSLARQIMEMLAKSFGENWKRRNDCFESDKYCISSFFGHLYELYSPDDYNPKYKRWNAADLPIIPRPFKLKYKGDAKKRGRFLAELAAKSDIVINACDPDREGEGIFRIWYDCEHIKKPIKRLWATSLALKDLTKAWSNLHDGSKYEGLSAAQRCRMKSDWLVGMNGSRAYAIASGERISIGRVQTPTLNLIVKRDTEVENFKESLFYMMKGTWKSLEFNYMEENETKFDLKPYLDKKRDECLNKPFYLKSFEEKRKKINPPKPFSMPDLQRESNKVFGYPLDKTLQIAQKLYESKLITYPRTDSPYLPIADRDNYYTLIGRLANEDQKRLLITQGGNVPCVKNTDSAHTAIIPTGENPAGLSAEETGLLDLITNRFITAFLKPCIYDQTTIMITDGEHDFRAIINYTVNKGFKDICTTNKPDNESEEQETPTKLAADNLKGTALINNLTVVSKKKAKPKYYTPATLLTAMITIGKTVESDEDREILKEVEGIGTAATRDKIPVELQKRGYIENKGKSIRSTSKGRQLISWVQDELKSAVLTAQWEKKLREMGEGKCDPVAFMEEIEAFVTSAVKLAGKEQPHLCADVNAEQRQCLKCAAPLTENEKGYFCTQECRFVLYKEIAGKKLPEKNIDALFKTGKSGMIDGFRKTDNSGTFSACIIVGPPDYKPKYVFDVALEKSCPICKGTMTEFFKGIKCNNTECGFIVWNNVSGKNISTAQINKLLINGKTDKVDGFVSAKNGKKFSAYLVVDKEAKRVVFKFGSLGEA